MTIVDRPPTRPGGPAVRDRPRPMLPTGGAGRLALLFASVAALLVVLAGFHLTQGTSGIGVADLWRFVTGGETDARGAMVSAVLSGARIPRLVTGLLIGAILGLAGVALQSLARNPLASPDTLAVNAGAQFAVTVVAALGISVPVLPGNGVAFVGGLAAAAVVVLIGGRGSTARLVLAGTALAMALSAVTSTLMILFQQETAGLFAWGNGSLLQIDLTTVRQLLPVVVPAVVVLLLLSRRMDLLALGDDTAATLGINVGRLRLLVLLLAVLLATTAVATAGPIGFVGLFAPATVALLVRFVPDLARHRVRYPAAALIGAITVIGADVLLRKLFGDTAGVNVPTGVLTTVLGAVLLVVIARRSSAGRVATSTGAVATGSRRRFRIVLTIAVATGVSCLTLGVILGGRLVLLGDLPNWLAGRSSVELSGVLDERIPRVLAAFLAGAALAAAGTSVQAVCRNPLAEPGLLGITAGAGLGAVLVITVVPAAGTLTVMAAAAIGAAIAFGVVYLLARRGGLDSGRLVLVGIGAFAGGSALTSMVIVVSDPWNQVRALTWLAGSTYGRTMVQVLPVAVLLAVLLPTMLAGSRRLDLMAVDDDAPRLLGVEVPRARLWHLGGAALLTAAAVSAIGVVGFVGLVAPHCARALVGARHARVLPVAALLGGVLVSLGDTLGRTVIFPAQLPAGLVATVLGAPYFIYLLWRTRD